MDSDRCQACGSILECSICGNCAFEEDFDDPKTYDVEEGKKEAAKTRAELEEHERKHPSIKGKDGIFRRIK